MTQGKQLKDVMSRIIRAAQVIKRDAYDVSDDAQVQMKSLVILLEKAKTLMDAMKPLVEEPMMELDLEDSVENTTAE